MGSRSLFRLLKTAVAWVMPRIVPAIVWVVMLPFIVSTRVLIGAPIWAFSFVSAVCKKRRPIRLAKLD